MKTLTITYLDGSKTEVRPSPGDIVRFERHFDMAIAGLEQGARLEHVLFLAWTALRRTGQEERDFEEFLDVVGEAGEDPKEETAPPPT
jgi:hypothetical protein